MIHWNAISNIGLQKNYNQDFKNQIILQNNVNALVCLVYFVIGLIYFAFSDNITAIFIESLILLNLLAYYVQKKYYHKFALSLLLVSSYLSIFYFDSYAGLSSGAFLYYPAVILSLFFLFNFKKDKGLILIHISIIVVLILVHQYTNHTLFKSNTMTDTMKSMLFIANAIFSALSIFYFIFIGLKSKK